MYEEAQYLGPGSFAYKNTGFEASVSTLEQINTLTVAYFQGF